MKDKGFSAVDLLGVQLLQRSNGRKRRGYLEDQLVLLVWLKCGAQGGEEDGVRREEAEKEAGVADPSQHETFVCLVTELGLVL